MRQWTCIFVLVLAFSFGLLSQPRAGGAVSASRSGENSSVVFSEYARPVLRITLQDKGYSGDLREYRNLSTGVYEIYNEKGFLIEEMGQILLPVIARGAASGMTNVNAANDAARMPTGNARILYVYDEGDALTEITWEPHKIIFKYSGGKLVEEEHYTGGGLKWKMFYLYTGDALSEKRIYEGTGGFAHSFIFLYDRKGVLQEIEKRTSRPDSEIRFASTFIDYYYEYDKSGRMIQCAWGSGEQTGKTNATVEYYAYSAAGGLERRERGTYEENIFNYKHARGSAADSIRVKTNFLVDIMRWFYTPEGRIREESTHEQSGHVQRYREKRLCEYGENGLLLKESFFELGVQKSERVYEYDAQGNPVQVREYIYTDTFGKITKSLAKEEKRAYSYRIEMTIEDGASGEAPGDG